MTYPTFQRLALFAASHDGAIDSQEWLHWLLKDEALNLWSGNTMRETMRLLVLQGANLRSEERVQLERSILQGPARNKALQDQEEERWKLYHEHTIWLHLAKLQSGGAELGPLASQRLTALSKQHPNWLLSPNEREEFSHWMGGTGDPDFDLSKTVAVAPRELPALVEWLKQKTPDRSPFYKDTWEELCRTRFALSLAALCKLADSNLWPVERWNVAFQTWREAPHKKRSLRYAGALVLRMPADDLQACAHSASAWLQALTERGPVLAVVQRAAFLAMCRKMLTLPLPADTGMITNGKPIDEPVMEAINHPVGHVATALINLLLSQKPSDGQSLPGDMEALFTMLCDRAVARFRHGRVILASRAIALFRVDRPWASANLLPLFNWATTAAEAKGAWEGFMWSPRLYLPLMSALKIDFLATSSHYVALAEHRRQFATFLTYAALAPLSGYSALEFSDAIGRLPPEGLREVSGTLRQALESALDKKSDYFFHRVMPFWQKVWPKEIDRASSGIADELGHMCLAAAEDFPAAVEMVLAWLRPTDHPSHLITSLYQSKLCKTFPWGALQLLNAVLEDQRMIGRDLLNCLDEIGLANPALKNDAHYLRLHMLARRGI